jgi:hypothetical protein
MWYGKYDDEDTPIEKLEKRIKKLENKEKREEKDDNFSMTGSYAGGDDDNDE